MKLVIVESPNKCAKIQHHLGTGFEVVATAGHFRDLPERQLGVDLGTFEPTYEVDPAKKGLLAKIRSRAAEAEEIFLATDADREGEAISWHLAQALHLHNPKRMRFQEITAAALKKAVAAAGAIDQHLVDAQQGRRVLDRLVGYQVSPLLRCFGTNHSAGRVQSAALHLVAERERARTSFKPEPYWTLAARYGEGFKAQYATLNDAGELVVTHLASQADADAVAARARGAHVVKGAETKPVERRPKAPFTTSTLQQAASVTLKLRPARTMEIAQKLFEAGAITYHRSDSVVLSEEAITMARAFLAQDYPEALPDHAPTYKNKSTAQEAHEAIRPTSLDPAVLTGLQGDELRLYDLIRRRFLACQCKPALFDQTTVAVESGDTTWRARGAVVQFLSWLRYMAEDEESEGKGEPEPKLPAVTVGQVLRLEDLEVKRQETKPPSRFTQASLIREMEKTGIGRPSTYASTVGVLFGREYIAEEKTAVYPTVRGLAIDGVLAKGFQDLVEPTYTAAMEEKLDEIAAGNRRWRDEVRAWYGPFAKLLAAAPAIFAAEAPTLSAGAHGAPKAPKPTGKSCPKCGKELHLHQGKKGAFLGCSGYPECKYTADPTAKPSEQKCPKCGRPMTELENKFGRYARCDDRACGTTIDLNGPVDEPCPICKKPMVDRGQFLGCSGYPECKGRFDKKELKAAKKAERKCPDCGAWLLEKKGAKGKFLGCSAFPNCKHTRALESSSNAREKPSRARSAQPSTAPARTCPECNAPLQLRKGSRGEFWGCTGFPRCRHTEETTPGSHQCSPG